MKKNITLFTTIFCLGLSTVYAGIRVYDPATGKDADANTIQVPQKKKPTAAAIKAEKSYQEAVKAVSAHDYTTSYQDMFPLGAVAFFINSKVYTPSLAQKIKTILGFKGLEVEVFTELEEPEAYFKWLKHAEKLQVDIEFKVDIGAYQAVRHKVDKYETIVYYPPTGGPRYYPFVEFAKLERKLKKLDNTLKSRGKKGKKR